MRIKVNNAYIKVDACSGPVSVQLAATTLRSTNSSDDESNAYGGIVSI